MTARELPGTIGRYRIEGVLGEGAMSIVYAGFDPSINRHLAIKCLRDEVARDATYRRRFLAEARAAGTLTHPYIVTIYDVGEADGRPYIAMERLRGETLADRVAHEGFPPIAVVIDLVGQIAAALDFAHRHGVVHQDIKPENIILVEGWTHAKVNDFGVARLQDETQHDGMVAGTPTYMSPEQLRGESTDGRSDLFSLGVVLFWLLAGETPWRESEVDRLLAERRDRPEPTLTPRDPATPDLLAEIARTLLQMQPEQRYQHGHEVIDDLRHARRELERLRADPVATRILPMRVRWAAILGVVLAVTLLAGLGAVYVKQDDALTDLALDFGASLGRTIAQEAAEDLLIDDRGAVWALVEDMQRNEQISYLAVANRGREVIASARGEEVGEALVALPETQRRTLDDGIVSHHGQLPSTSSSEALLLFDVPIRYQSHPIGTLRLGVDSEPLAEANRTTLLSMITALLATLVVVLGAAWWLFRRLLAPIDVLRDALLRVARGETGHRIRLLRRDEFGRLFTTFNLMSESLSRRKAPPSTDPTNRVADNEPTRVIQPVDESGDTDEEPRDKRS